MICIFLILKMKITPMQNCTKFENYMYELKTYKFCLSPPGRGLDTHRAWEALMMGTIPLMISTTQDHLFEKLPVVIVDDWEQITTQFLNKKYGRYFFVESSFRLSATSFPLKKAKIIMSGSYFHTLCSIILKCIKNKS